MKQSGKFHYFTYLHYVSDEFFSKSTRRLRSLLLVCLALLITSQLCSHSPPIAFQSPLIWVPTKLCEKIKIVHHFQKGTTYKGEYYNVSYCPEFLKANIIFSMLSNTLICKPDSLMHACTHNSAPCKKFRHRVEKMHTVGSFSSFL